MIAHSYSKILMTRLLSMQGRVKKTRNVWEGKHFYFSPKTHTSTSTSTSLRLCKQIAFRFLLLLAPVRDTRGKLVCQDVFRITPKAFITFFHIRHNYFLFFCNNSRIIRIAKCWIPFTLIAMPSFSLEIESKYNIQHREINSYHFKNLQIL